MTVPDNFSDVVSEWMNGQISAVQAMRKLDMKKTAFYKTVKMLQSKWGDLRLLKCLIKIFVLMGCYYYFVFWGHSPTGDFINFLLNVDMEAFRAFAFIEID